MIPIDRFAHLTGAAREAALAQADATEREQLRRIAELRAVVESLPEKFRPAPEIPERTAAGFAVAKHRGPNRAERRAARR